MTIKGNLIYITAKEIKDATLGVAAIVELEDALLNSGYELSVESVNAR